MGKVQPAGRQRYPKTPSGKSRPAVLLLIRCDRMAFTQIAAIGYWKARFNKFMI